jgi:hypothetical protein
VKNSPVDPPGSISSSLESLVQLIENPRLFHPRLGKGMNAGRRVTVVTGAHQLSVNRGFGTLRLWLPDDLRVPRQLRFQSSVRRPLSFFHSFQFSP